MILNNNWQIRIADEAKKDYFKLDGSVRKQVLAGILKVSEAPLPSPNGYGKPLGNKSGNNLTKFLKIKFRKIGIRIVYTLVLEEHIMNVLVICERDENFCYDMAIRLYQKYGDKIFNNIFGDFYDK